MKIKALLIDDEVNNLHNLKALLTTYCPEVEVLATAMDANEGRGSIIQYQPDLVFLDIQMPGKDGFELLKSLPHYDFEVIFVTAYNQYGIQAVKFAAIDYLLKPINPEELRTAVNRVAIKNRQKKQNLSLENLVHLLRNKEEQRIALTTQKETRFIPVTQIMHCESSNNYTIFFLSHGEKIVASRPIYEFEDLLGIHGFIRCHQSYLVNKKYIKSWVKEDGGYLLMVNGAQVPVSRTKKEIVKNALK